jgi:hypothetical protein
MKTLRPVFIVVSLVLVIGLACTFGAGTKEPPTQPPAQPTVEEQPTQAPEPTAEPTTEQPINTSEPQATDAPTINDYFTEEFDQDPGSAWNLNIVGPGAEINADKAKTSFANGVMRFELPAKDLYAYYTYNGFQYDDVRVEIRADNRGVNTNNISLICRDSKEGWYEWSVGSGGDWYLYAVTNDKYNLISSGGTKFLKQGKEVNDLAMVCKGTTISLFVNNNEIKNSPFTEKKYSLRSGGVGFNISSLKVVPVIVEVQWFKISQP